MAPTIDAVKGESGLHSLWDAGRDLTAAAATCGEVQNALDAAQHEYAAAAAERGRLQNILDAAQDEYTAAHARAVAVGWSPGELLDVGLPRPAPSHRDPQGPRSATGTDVR